MQDFYLYNTEKREKERFEPYEKGQVKMYTCGPTVYNYAHIGNFRTYLFEDLLRKTLQYFGYRVEQVMNITDIDDKTLKGAIANHISLNEFTEPFTQAFFADLATLNIQPVEHYPRATDYIAEMVAIIQDLLAKKIAYTASDGSVYYSISQFPTYGRLSNLQMDELKAGASERVILDEYEKESVSDFVLWKAYDPERDGKIFWESPLGRGRPGWHIECSAMAMKILGNSLDIHVGGIDNMFPHHENEIAQSEAYSGERFVRYWMHSQHLLVDHKKMSKSLGNFYTLRDLLAQGYTGQEVRYALISTHYRTNLNFSLQALTAARATLHRLQDFLYRLKNIIQPGKCSSTIQSLLDQAEERFRQALGDDLNISEALAVLFSLVKEVNIKIDDGFLHQSEAQAVIKTLQSFDVVLGIMEPVEEEVPQFLQKALVDRQQARLEKNYQESDRLRDLILQAGYVIEDTPHGPRLKKA